MLFQVNFSYQKVLAALQVAGTFNPTNQKSPFCAGIFVAERVGFEPTVDRGPTTVFETVPFNRSGTSPISLAARNYTLYFDALVQFRVKNIVVAFFFEFGFEW